MAPRPTIGSDPSSLARTRSAPGWALIAIAVVACALASSIPLTGQATRAQAAGIGVGAAAALGAGAVLPSAIPSSCDYYISPTGSDTAVGSQSAPLRTLSAALTKVAPGGSICVTAGAWGTQRLLLNKSGTPSARIGLYGIGSPVVRGIDVKASNVTVGGFEVTAGGADVNAGIYVEGTNVDVTDNNVHHLGGTGIETASNGLGQTPKASRVRISNNTVSYINGFGIIVSGTNHTVDHNDVSRMFTNGDHDADGMRAFGSGHTISDNYVHDIFESDSSGIGDPHSDCLQSFNDNPAYLEDPLRNLTVERNVCSTDRHCTMIANIAGPLGGGIVIRDNVCHSRKGSFGYLIGDNSGQSKQFDDVKVVNNVVVVETGYFGVYSYNATNLTIANNILYGMGTAWYGSSTGPDRGFVARNNLTKAPVYADPTNPDPRLRYRPAAGSPTIDAGSTTDASASDILGNARVADGNGDGTAVVDIGPYEFTGGGAPAPTPPPANATPGTLSGALPANGLGLVVWGGGTIEQLRTATSGKGCGLAAFWVIENAVFIGYVPGAPSVVNQPFATRFPGALPSTPGIVVCRSG